MNQLPNPNQQKDSTFHEKTPPARRGRFFFLAGAVLFVGMVFLSLISPPSDFPIRTTITVNKGETLDELSKNLKAGHVVKSALLLNNIVILEKGEKKVVAGDYYFDEPLSVFGVARRITRGEFGLAPLKITFPEGLTASEFSEIARRALPQFNSADFLLKSTEKEGYLFPDTYLFLSNAKAEDVLAKMQENFTVKMKSIEKDFSDSKRSRKDIIIMASLLEEEAKTSEARRIVSGILWKRLDRGMSLQVDSTFKYINGKNTYEITSEDLAIDSPYNTYKYRGFPPTPISNPGMDSIQAALHPTETSYYYFLSDKKGGMYYGTNFEEHKKNKATYFGK